MTYDEIVDKLIETQRACEHKSIIVNGVGGNTRYEFCRHKPEECEYKRYLVMESKMNGGPICPMK